MSITFTHTHSILELSTRVTDLEILNRTNMKLNKQILEKIEKLEEEKEKEKEITSIIETDIENHIICCCCDKVVLPGIYSDLQFNCCFIDSGNNYYKCKDCVCIIHLESELLKKPFKDCCLKRFTLQRKMLEDYEEENRSRTIMSDDETIYLTEKLEEEKEVSSIIESNIDDDIRCCCCNVKLKSLGVYNNIEFICCAGGDVNPLINDNNYYKCKDCVCILHIEACELLKEGRAKVAVNYPPKICCLKRVSSAFLLQSKALEDYKKENKPRTIMNDDKTISLTEIINLRDKAMMLTNEQLLEDVDPILEKLDPSITVIKGLLAMLNNINTPTKHIQIGVDYNLKSILEIPRNFNVKSNRLLVAKLYSILYIILEHKNVNGIINIKNSHFYGFRQDLFTNLIPDGSIHNVASLRGVKKVTRHILEWFHYEFDSNVVETYEKSFDTWRIELKHPNYNYAGIKSKNYTKLLRKR